MINKSVYRLVMHVIFALGHQKKKKSLAKFGEFFNIVVSHEVFCMLIFFPPPLLTHPFSVTTATEVEDLVGGKRDFLNFANPTFDKKEDE